jgi:signal transduction histidine kinase
MEQTRTEFPHGRERLGPRARACDKTGYVRPRRRVRPRLEAHLRRQQAALAAEHRHLQEVHRHQTTVVAHAAHELRTPLTAIIGYLALMLEGEAGPVAGRQRTWLDLARRHAERLVDLIENLLDLACFEAGRVALNYSALDLVHLIKDVIQLLRPQLEAKGQRLTLEVDPTLPGVLGDPACVTQILTNLLSNAHKYTPARGHITVRVRGEERRVQVEVQDTGIGLCPEDQARLFTPFFRARHPSGEDPGGTGLGLAITRALVERHGGALTVRSVPGHGATFSVTLPYHEPQCSAGVGPQLNEHDRMHEAKEMTMRSHRSATVWGTSLDSSRAREANAWYQQLKAWSAARKAAREQARLAALNVCWNAQLEAFSPRRTDSALEMALAQGRLALAAQPYHFIY